MYWKLLALSLVFLLGFCSRAHGSENTVPFAMKSYEWEVSPFDFTVAWCQPGERTKVEALRPSCPYSKGYRYRKNYHCGVSCHRKVA